MEIAARRRRVLRTEVTSAAGCAVIGATFLAGDHTMREMSIVLFGWSAGCAVHLTQTVITDRLARRKRPRKDDQDAKD